MIMCELKTRGESYVTPEVIDGFFYCIESFWSTNSEEIVIGRRKEGEVFYKLMFDDKWEDETDEIVHKIFRSVEEAFGVLNNILIDDITIGTPVHISTGSDRDHQEWDGIVVPNDRYNDDYPYKVMIDGKDDSYGVFAVDEVTIIK